MLPRYERRDFWLTDATTKRGPEVFQECIFLHDRYEFFGQLPKCVAPNYRLDLLSDVGSGSLT